ncbi:uncharacterized protein ACRADG_003938 isoform 1-T2 [Cochliomyia hominivorax]
MLTVLVQPVLKCMHVLHTTATFILTASYHIGQAIFLLLIHVCNIIKDIFTAFAIIGEELFCFLCELNSSITAVTSFMRSSANGGINCLLEAVGVFLKHMANFFINTRLHSKLLATQVGGFIADFLNLIRNALLLIADCSWWLITLLPRWLLYAIIVVGDFIVETITSLRQGLVYVVQVIVQDIFRLTIGMVLLIVLWHNRRRLALTILRCMLKIKIFLRLCGLCLMQLSRRVFRRQRNNQVFTTPRPVLGTQRRSHLPRSSVSPSNSDKTLDPTQRCVICRDRQKCVLLLPCRHLCLCEECADYMFFSSQRQNCPLCRTFIDHSMSVYI